MFVSYPIVICILFTQEHLPSGYHNQVSMNISCLCYWECYYLNFTLSPELNLSPPPFSTRLGPHLLRSLFPLSPSLSLSLLFILMLCILLATL